MTESQLLYAAVTALASVIAGLASAVVSLFFWFKRNYDRIIKRLEKCEQDRAELWREIAELKGRPCNVLGCPLYRKPESSP